MNSNENGANSTTSNQTTAATNNHRPVRPRKDPRWDEAKALVTNGAATSAEVVSINKNREGRPCGLNVKIANGLEGFLPGSELPRGEDQEALIGQTISVKVLEANPRKAGGCLKVSRKAVVIDEQRAFVEGIEKDSTVTGTIVRVTELKDNQVGYFVNIGPVDGLLHAMQVPLKHGQPQELKEGDEVTCRVMGKNVENCKVSLTMRAPRSERPDNSRNRGNGPVQSKSQESGRESTGRTTPPPAKVKAVRPQPQPQPKKQRINPPTPIRSKKSGFTQSFTSFADLAAAFKAKDSGTPETSTESSVSEAPAATEPVVITAEPTSESTNS